MKRQREHWESALGFILTAAGSAIGLGTLWKFPIILDQNGGGLFLLAFFACMFLLGVPLYMGELILGRRAQRGPVGIFEELAGKNSAWKLVPWLSVATSFAILSYYCVLAGWGLNYVFMGLSKVSPGQSYEEIEQTFKAMQRSPGINLFWFFIFLLINTTMLVRGVRKGIEQWSKVMTSALFVILLLLFCYCTTLPSFGKAAHFVFYPDFSEFKAESWIQALSLSFFTLSIGQAVLLTYGSYMKKDSNIQGVALIIACSVMLTALLVAMIIFPIRDSIEHTHGNTDGPHLVFAVLPYMFGKIPGGGVVSIVFFMLFVFSALTSSVALFEVVIANCMDLFHWSRKRAVYSVAGAVFLLGVPTALSWSGGLFTEWKTIYGISFYEALDNLVDSWMLPLGALFMSIYVAWIFPKEDSKEELLRGGTSEFVYKIWLTLVRIVPLAILVILIRSLISNK